MSDYLATGASNFQGHSTQTTVVNTHVQDARSRYYDIPYEKSGGRAEGDAFRSPERGESKPLQAKTRPTATSRYNMIRWSEAARTAAERLSQANKLDDFMEATTAGTLLLDSLARLWRFRDVRETEFAEVVNMLQTAIAKVQFEVITPDKCRAIFDVIDQCLLSGAVDESQVRLAKELMRNASLDPYRGFSMREG